jgi:N-acetylglucosaminyldiphosphoundecaprenol N-acetyl-beta-D-mannosaminyltransferase
VDRVTEGDALRLVRGWTGSGPPAQIVTVNAEFVMLARRNCEFAQALHDAALATPDGAAVVWAMRRQGVRQDRRVGGADLIWSISEQAARDGTPVFLLGGAEAVAAGAARALQARCPELRVAGTFAGSPQPEEEAAIVDLIRRSRAGILFVAFGAPQQEIWIARNLARTGVGVAMGVGGSFDYLAGTARRAPRWMRERGLEWLWRLIRQPRRLPRMLALPRFVWLVWRCSGRAGSEERGE